MIIKFTRKEALKLFSWRGRRKIKKHEKLKNKNENYRKAWDDSVDEIDNLLAFGDGNDS